MLGERRGRRVRRGIERSRNGARARELVDVVLRILSGKEITPALTAIVVDLVGAGVTDGLETPAVAAELCRRIDL